MRLDIFQMGEPVGTGRLPLIPWIALHVGTQECINWMHQVVNKAHEVGREICGEIQGWRLEMENRYDPNTLYTHVNYSKNKLHTCNYFYISITYIYTCGYL